MIQDCKSKTMVSLFLQLTMCLANITCCLDAVCYYFIAKEVKSARHFLHRRLTTVSGQQRRTMNSTSEL